jgi:hypothetical protein
MAIFIIACVIGLIPAVIARSRSLSKGVGEFVGWWVFGAMLFIVALPVAIFSSPRHGAPSFWESEHDRRTAPALESTVEASQPPPLPTHRHSSPVPKIVLVSVLAAALVGGAVYSWNAGYFDGIPTTCADFSVRRMNSIYENSFPGKMGLRILAVLSITDTGSTSVGLRCTAKTFTTHGEMTFAVTTRTINGVVYMEMAPSLF